MSGRVYLVGAGCGTADLITLRGKACLEHCDAVVYDDLIDPALLNFVPAGAQRIYMGKRSGKHSAPQQEITQTLISLARQGKVTARLKGGDPFVFGRGGEELLALQEAGIPFDVVPGISSAIAIPAGAGIPVTHRGMSRSFHVITGHTADTPDFLPADLPHLAKCDGTLVFLMGLGQLSTIAAKLVEYGRSPLTPVAVISGGNSPNPAAVRGTLADIVEKAAHVLPPAVILVGETAALDLRAALPLSGIRVGVTGTPSVTERLTSRLHALGAQVHTVDAASVVPLSPDLSPLLTPAPKWLVFTSPNGVEVFFRQLTQQGVDLRRLFPCRFAVIGRTTAQALSRHGFIPDLCPGEHTSRALAEALVSAVEPGEEIHLLRSKKGAAVLVELPCSHGFSVQDIPLYDTVPTAATPALPSLPLHYLVFGSGEGVNAYFRRGGTLPEHTFPVCIGSATAARLADYTARQPLLPTETTADGLVQAILLHHRA